MSNLIAIEVSYMVYFIGSSLYRTRVTRREFVRYEAELEFKRMFVRYISHEVRTPLNTAIMGLQVLVEAMNASNDRENMDVVDDIQKSCDIAVNVLNELLTFDKLEGGTLLLEKSNVKALDLLQETVVPFLIQARQAGITLSVSSASASVTSACVNLDNSSDLSSVILNVDVNKIQQVIRNLVSNGLKFTSPGGTVSVLVGVVDCPEMPEGEACRLLKVDVIDSGAGISEENQRRLFNEIVQFNPAKLQKGGGSGLGLYISNGIVKLHGGSLSVHSDGEGLGSTFTLLLPAGLDSTETSPGDATNFQSALEALDRAAADANSTPVAQAQHSNSRCLHTDMPFVNIGNAIGCDVYVTRDTENQLTTANAANAAAAAASSHAIMSILGSTDTHDLNDLRSNQDDDGQTVSPADKIDAHSPRRDSGGIDVSGGGVEADPRSTLHILVVDDTATSRKMQCRLLRGRCKSSVEAEDGQLAVAVVSESMGGVGGAEAVPIDLILMDSVMPVMGGLEATKTIRELGYTGVIFGVTGNVSADDITSFLNHGANAVLPKPLNVKAYDYAVKRLLLGRLG